MTSRYTEQVCSHLRMQPRALMTSLKACAKQKDLHRGSRIHADIVRTGLLDKDVFVGSSLIRYAQHGQYQEALDCFGRLRHEGLSPNAVTFVCILKVCASLGDTDKGQEIHVEVARMGLLEKDVFVGSAVVNMYAKFDLLPKAQDVFDKLPVRDVVLWSALIAGYAQNGHGEKALKCFEEMQCVGLSPNIVTFLSILKACASTGAVDKGQEIHAEIAREGLEKETVVGTALVDMYAKCGLLEKAQDIVDTLPTRDIILWNALLAGYAQYGHGKEAVAYFEQMQHEGIFPDVVTFTCVLKACGSIGAIEKGQVIHTKVISVGLLEKDIVVSSALVEMYVKCGMLGKAQWVFDKLPMRSLIMWNVLIVAFAQQGNAEEALNYYKRMQLEGLSPDAAIFVCVLKACGSLRAVETGERIHAEIAREGLLENHHVVATALIDMYAKCGLLAKAQQVFDIVLFRDAVLWNALIAGYAQHGGGEEALNCFEWMKLEGLSPNTITFVCILKACTSMEALERGLQIHSEVVTEGLLEKHINLGNALIDMYMKCGSPSKAQDVFDDLTVRDVVTWNTLIAGYVDSGHYEEAMNCFKQMKCVGPPPDVFTFVCILKACGSMQIVDEGQAIHAKIVREGLLEKHTVIGMALADMYGHQGLLEKAQEVLDTLPVRDVVSWNALISGYCQHGHGEEALICFNKMQHEGFSPDAITFVCILKACGSIGATAKGQEIHTELLREGLLKEHSNVGNALVDMYAKCGFVAKAQEVFDKLPTRALVAWNALVTGYALFGKAENVFQLFENIVGEGTKPDSVTFLSVLNACSHAGLLEKGQVYFAIMSLDYNLVPTLEHHTSILDLFCRAGHLDKAVAIIKEMPYSANLRVWHILLSACQRWGNAKLGRLAFEHAVQVDERDTAAYVCLSNIYGDAG